MNYQDFQPYDTTIINLELQNYGRSSNSSNNNSDSILPVNIIIHSTIACIGIVANATVVIVFLKHKKLRRKVPNIFIINQVLYTFLSPYIGCFIYKKVIPQRHIDTQLEMMLSGLNTLRESGIYSNFALDPFRPVSLERFREMFISFVII